ncbi:hypothetical protein HUK80_06195 [Flavobacterium sp. MAH-1]|uniref:Uncharacterized protein n=1 Tax=Flavobacterium agri TaxID=2743471 RepID=A0A7Y8Y3A8_9FLAO|nr:hypothetical protein [Flavobacterium agri]NUY80480.1 hypothetical protein [Flavobacterium agri]NYA70505.1 hypothetical protein [Flavobacterium agri]
MKPLAQHIIEGLKEKSEPVIENVVKETTEEKEEDKQTLSLLELATVGNDKEG